VADRGSERGDVAVALDAPEAALRFGEAGGGPAAAHVAVAPALTGGQPFDAMRATARSRRSRSHRSCAPTPTGNDPIPELVAATPPEAIIRTCLYERSPLERLSVGRIALAGDAAHPMLPNLGQGACQAIEDAVVLADELAATDDVVAALRRYSAHRAQHTAAVVKASRQMSRIAHLRNPLAAGLRNALLRASPPSSSLRRLEPIVGHVPRRALNPDGS